jgi:hypothetical protein
MADTGRWEDPASYKREWASRSATAASLIADGSSVLEIGVGTGVFKRLVAGRVRYLGADLAPLDEATLQLDLDCDPLPDGHFDYAVLLGVFTYLHRPEDAAAKLCSGADRIIASYCCRRSELSRETVHQSRARRGWCNSFDRQEFVGLFAAHGHALVASRPLISTSELEELIMEFRRPDPDRAPAPAASV